MPKVIDCDQHYPDGQPTPEWLAARCGRITASRLADVMAYLKSGKGEMKARADYRIELVAERLTRNTASHYVSKEMKFGSLMEDEARSAYEIAKQTMVQNIGFCVHPTMDFSGASPDGWVGDKKIIEIKCPTTATYLGWRKSKQVPQEYVDQILWNMVCGERFEADFIGYDPRLPENLQLLVIPVPYDWERISLLEAEVRQMEAEIQAEIAAIS